MWQPQWRALLDAGHRAIRLDFGGYGGSAMPAGSYNDADDVMELLDANGVESAIVVGSSFGGQIGQEIAARWPKRVGTLILVCAATLNHPPTPDIATFGERENELLEAGKLDEAVALNLEMFVGPRADPQTRDLIARMQRRAFEVQDGTDDEAVGLDYDFDLADITARTVLITGGHDSAYFAEIADAVAAQIPDSRQVRLDWAGHLPSLEDPAAFNPILLDLIEN